MSAIFEAFAQSAENYWSFIGKPWGKLFYHTAWNHLNDHMSSINSCRVLDVGCGFGVTSQHLARKGHHVTGTEPTEQMLKIARQHYESQGLPLEFKCLQLEELPGRFAHPFDWVLCHNVLEYIVQPQEGLRKLGELTAPNGYLSIIAHNPVGKLMKKAIVHKDPKDALLNIDNHQEYSSVVQADLTTYDYDVLVKWLKELGYQVVDRYGIHNLYGYITDNDIKMNEAWDQEMTELELELSRRSPFREIAIFAHIIARKTKG
jgi:S-adenosylmethionine-dependent methyltransferase